MRVGLGVFEKKSTHFCLDEIYIYVFCLFVKISLISIIMKMCYYELIFTSSKNKWTKCARLFIHSFYIRFYQSLRLFSFTFLCDQWLFWYCIMDIYKYNQSANFMHLICDVWKGKLQGFTLILCRFRYDIYHKTRFKH